MLIICITQQEQGAPREISQSVSLQAIGTLYAYISRPGLPLPQQRKLPFSKLWSKLCPEAFLLPSTYLGVGMGMGSSSLPANKSRHTQRKRSELGQVWTQRKNSLDALWSFSEKNAFMILVTGGYCGNYFNFFSPFGCLIFKSEK